MLNIGVPSTDTKVTLFLPVCQVYNFVSQNPASIGVSRKIGSRKDLAGLRWEAERLLAREWAGEDGRRGGNAVVTVELFIVFYHLLSA